MSYLMNDAAAFAEEAAEGFVAANASLVRLVPGGTARRSATPEGEVAVVIGGGSGHYPAFAGFIGQGLAHAAAMGNIFASPSSQQVLSAARSVATPAGVLLSYGNYAGDALNFDLAQERLREMGIPTRTVRVTDDIFSAPKGEEHRRRGIAGDLPVFKVAGWAAGAGYNLDAVADVAQRANDRTRSIGVGFTGCTLPGATEPVFTVPAGQMAVGMGIHGEPGIEMRPIPSADDLGKFFVDSLLGELPEGVTETRGAKVAAIINGLGSVKSEELFVVWRSVARELEAHGVEAVEPEVGEFATSFEMAGLSLTLMWLDEELEQAWRAPAHTPAFRKGFVPASELADAVAAGEDELVQLAPAATPEAAAAGEAATAAILAIETVIEREADELGRLDSIAGDGDHGIGMRRGSRAAAVAANAAAAAGADAGVVLAYAADEWADKAGGTSGALWGAGLRAAARVIGDTAPDAATIARAAQAAREEVQRFGKAEVGDKTLVDALVPFADVLTAEVAGGAKLVAAWNTAVAASQSASDATADLLPRMGRARPHTEKSLGTPDPGAVSFVHAMRAIAAVLDNSNSN
ncbi:L-erythrulose kinase [Leucobacter sp. BZR 635]